MLFMTIVRVAAKSLLANKLRSILAVLGIVIGVAAVISMLAIGAGAQKQVMDRISALGANLLMIHPGQTGDHGVRTGTQQNLTLDDARALLEQVQDITTVAPVVQGSAQFKYYNNNSRSSVTGTSVTYFPIRNFEIDKGRMFTEAEVERSARLAVLGPATVENLFQEEDAVGQRVKINGMNFTVVGVLKSKGDQGWFNPDDQAIIPYTTAMGHVFGVDYLREIDFLIKEGADRTLVQSQASAVLRTRHRLRPDADDDFNIRDLAEMAQTASSLTETFTILLGSVAGISLLVGGIGIMNIMLVTVTERTREIGIRKAIGAKDRDILRQFLIESIVMSGLGGLLGVMLGVGGAQAIAHLSQFRAMVTASSILLALSFSVGIGVFFGFYPARRAAMLNPIDALRYE